MGTGMTYVFEGLAVPRHDNGWDCFNERLMVDGVVLESFNQNPIVVMNFDYFNPPVGKAKVWVDKDGLHAKMAFTKKVARKILTAKLIPSIGFRTLEWSECNRGKRIHKKVELLCVALISPDKDCYKKFRKGVTRVIYPCGPPEIYSEEHELWNSLIVEGSR